MDFNVILRFVGENGECFRGVGAGWSIFAGSSREKGAFRRGWLMQAAVQLCSLKTPAEAFIVLTNNCKYFFISH